MKSKTHKGLKRVMSVLSITFENEELKKRSNLML